MLRKHLTFNVCCFFFLVICFALNGPLARAAQRENNYSGDLTSVLHVLHLEVTGENGQAEQIDAINSDGVDNVFFKILPSTPHVRIPLSEHLKLFFNVRSTLKDFYERYNNNNRKCVTLGIDIFF